MILEKRLHVCWLRLAYSISLAEERYDTRQP
jgi:hypothetical protein